MSVRLSLAESTLLRVFGRVAEVRAVEAVGDAFRFVTLGGPDLVDRRWRSGDMIQLSLGAWESRAYTPHRYDPGRGELQFVGFVHGNGIGSTWLSTAAVGVSCQLVGPRQALDLERVRGPAIFVGDETSFSTAAAIPDRRDVACIFEVTDADASRTVLERLGIRNGILILREPNERHLEAVEQLVMAAERPSVILTGKATTIAHLYKSLRRAGRSKTATNVAYWSPGRKGFSGVQR